MGMTIDYRKQGKVKISMLKYISEFLEDSPTGFNGTSVTPAANHLFEVNEKGKKLGENKREIFHHFVAKALFLTNPVTRDIQNMVAFICTRVKSPDEEDWKKLGSIIRYLQTTQGLKLKLKANNMHVVKWWVDAAHGLHLGMCGHYRQMMSLGRKV